MWVYSVDVLSPSGHQIDKKAEENKLRVIQILWVNTYLDKTTEKANPGNAALREQVMLPTRSRNGTGEQKRQMRPNMSM